MLYKRGVLKKFAKFSDKHKEQSSDGGALSKDDLQNFVKFTEKHLCRNLLFNKVAGDLKAAEAAAGDCKTRCY